MVSEASKLGARVIASSMRHGYVPPSTALGAAPRLRPAWAPTDPRWREAVDALAPGDLAWIERQWETAGGAPPEVDTTWLSTEEIHA